MQCIDYMQLIQSTIQDGHGVVKYNKGDLVGTFPKTNTNGQASLEHLYLGKYIIREYTAPDGYLIDTRDYSVTLSYAGQDVAVYD